jgi:hypothetical protein
MKWNKSKLFVFIALLVICVFTFNSSAREMDDAEWFGIVRSYFDATSRPGTETYKDWESGVKEEFGLTLGGLKFNYELLGVDRDDKMVVVAFLFGMTAFCYNKDGDKKRVEIVRMTIAAIDKKTKKIIGVKILNQAGPTVIHGWDGKDV